MLGKELIKVLSKIYKNQNSEYNFNKKISVYQKPDTLTEKQKIILEEAPFELNHIREYHHNDVIQELKSITENASLEHIVSNLFIKAVGSGFHRGLQPIFSYYFAKNMPNHSFEPFSKQGWDMGINCRNCGINKSIWQNDSENLFHLYIGYCRFGGYTEMLLDLKEVLTFKNIMATDDDKKTFLAVLDIIENAEDNETFSLLVKRLSKEKCLPNSNNTSRVWFVKCLAELGILRNKYEANYSVMNKFVPYNQKFEWELDIHKNSPARADVEFPVSAWRGKLGINREIVERILTNANKV